MKKIFNLAIFIIMSILFINIEAEAKSIDFENGKKFELYKIKDKEEIAYNVNLIEYYEKHPMLKKEEEIIERDLTLAYEITNFALNFVGNPYVLGGNSLTEGTDCSGFLQLVFSNFGIFVPRTSFDQSYYGEEIKLEDIEVGDIISYGYDGYPTHSALYLGNGMIVHAATPEIGITTAGMYIMEIISVRRVI